MVDFSPRLRLPRLDAGGGEAQRDYPTLQRQFADIVDANAGAQVVTSTTRPATPYIGQIIFETDTNLVMMWTGATPGGKGWVQVFNADPPTPQTFAGVHATRNGQALSDNNAWVQVSLNTFNTRVPTTIANFGSGGNAGRVEWGRNCTVAISAFAVFAAESNGNRRALRITRNGTHMSEFGEVTAPPFSTGIAVGLSMGAFVTTANDGQFFGVEVHNGGGNGPMQRVGLSIAAVGDPLSPV